MCTRILYETAQKNYIVGRSMDWTDEQAETNLWAFPQNMQRNGGLGEDSISWKSKYGSLIATMYDVATTDGINEVGLAGNILYLAETDYGEVTNSTKPTLSVAAWLQYILDNFDTVSQAVEALRLEPFTVVAPVLPNGFASNVHLSISDPSGDSAIFEYVKGKLDIHHNRDYKVMTNSPVYEQQLAINGYWDEIGGSVMLPGTYRAADRFARASYNLKVTPKFEDNRKAIAAVFSMMRNISVPIGIKDPEKPNHSMTLWRTIIDHKAKRYYFDSVFNPSVFWVDLANLDLKADAKPQKLDLGGSDILAGEVSANFKPAEPFKWLSF